MTEPLFHVSNHHVPNSGTSPDVDGDVQGLYFGYFANEYGEQAIYSYEHETGKATVRLGDAGWETVYPVVDGQAEGLTLGKAELLWLHACWMATGGTRR